MMLHADIHRQLTRDRRERFTREARESRLRRDARAIRRQLRKTG